MAGKLISMEGQDGSGKSSSIQFIKSHLESIGIDVVVTREPGGTPIAEAIRNLALTASAEKMTDKAELLLMFAARAQHYAHIILPALMANKWVVTDRYIDSSFAYQGYARMMGQQNIEWLEYFVLGNHRPDLTLLLDLPVEVGMHRSKNRGGLDRIEQEHLDFFKKVRRGFLLRAQQEPDRIKIIDAEQSQQAVHQLIKAKLDDLIDCSMNCSLA